MSADEAAARLLAYVDKQVAKLGPKPTLAQLDAYFRQWDRILDQSCQKYALQRAALIDAIFTQL